MSLHLHLGERDEARRLILAHHYSGRMPSGTSLHVTWHEDGGLFGDSGPAVAACLIGSPATGRRTEPVLELTRLVRTPDCDRPLSGLVADTVRWVKRKHLTDLIVSFADPGAGHHGGIYQACSWNYHGRRPRHIDGFIFNGQFVPARTTVATYGTMSPSKLRELGHEFEIHYDTGKHLYWLPLNRNGKRQAERMGLESHPYPKPNLGVAS